MNHLITYISRKEWKANKINGSWWFNFGLDSDWFYICILGLELSVTW